MKKSTRARILAMFDDGATWKNVEIAKFLGKKTNTISYHTGRLKKEGLLLVNSAGKMKRNPAPGVANTTIVVDPEPTTAVEPPPTSIKLLLLAAREGIDEALERIDAAEQALLGGV